MPGRSTTRPNTYVGFFEHFRGFQVADNSPQTPKQAVFIRRLTQKLTHFFAANDAEF
jgi:hypothetical protein